MNNKVAFIAKILLGVPLIIFGFNKFFLFANVAPPEGEIAQQFLGTMFGTYLAKFVGFIEIVGGVLLLIPKTSFVGMLLLLPVVANISVFHFAHDLPGNGIWLFTLATQIAVVYVFKDRFKTLLLN